MMRDYKPNGPLYCRRMNSNAGKYVNGIQVIKAFGHLAWLVFQAVARYHDSTLAWFHKAGYG